MIARCPSLHAGEQLDFDGPWIEEDLLADTKVRDSSGLSLFAKPFGGNAQPSGCGSE
jgi:hypothetical protein